MGKGHFGFLRPTPRTHAANGGPTFRLAVSPVGKILVSTASGRLKQGLPKMARAQRAQWAGVRQI